ncbi:hypothetical protein KGF56_000748 [Candida oxycetoniae]|uniref:DNA replication factor Cdt1 C-terminal domain-containing protein n=1 Tax=Candida oxycetoniae TaxID=497107 RepID=A0AAI9SZV2_9ASCO|nr:uncharacterized protein KGF56_000748 [Candida oxycetoniae]KAI3406268.1 hypothetical protein KGF56_000748 [Candida oxycetoniae]
MVSNVKSIDSVLMLHFATYSANPPLYKILEQASTLGGRPIGMVDIEQILAISPLYKIVRVDELLTIGFQTARKDRDRISAFLEDLNHWIKTNTNKLEMSKVELSTIMTRHTSPPRRIMKPRSARSSPVKKKKFDELKNMKSKFEFLEKDAQIERSNNQGLSLLDRIKLKESKAKEEVSAKSLETKYQEYLTGKVCDVYDIIYQLYKAQPDQFKSFSMARIIQVVKDSLEHPLDEQEISDIVKLIALKLIKYNLIEKNNIQILRVRDLNREEDLKLFELTPSCA